jgi:hypothetical protein
MTTVAPMRVEHLRRRIVENKPKAVIFYSRKYQAWWEQVAGAAFPAATAAGVQIINTTDTRFVMTAHPVAHGVSSEYFVKAGKALVGAIFSSLTSI